jgi:hypothetical protein
VLSPVDLDGALRRYTVRTPYGDFKMTGGQLTRARIRELNALATGRKSLVITGTATPLAKKNLAARGWKVTENVK